METTQNTPRNSLTFRLLIGAAVAAMIVIPVFAKAFLKTHGYAIFQVAVYFLMVILIASRLYTCLKLARGAGRLAPVQLTAVWFVFGVIAVASRYEELIGSQNIDYINLVTNVAMLLALFNSLQVVESLMRAATPTAVTAVEKK